MQNRETQIKDIQDAMLNGRYKEELAAMKKGHDPELVKASYNLLPEKEKDLIKAASSTTQAEFDAVTEKLLAATSKEALAAIRASHPKAVGDTCYRFLPVAEKQRITAIASCTPQDIEHAKERLLRCKDKESLDKEKEWLEGLYGLAIANMSGQERQQVETAEAVVPAPLPLPREKEAGEGEASPVYDFNEIIAASNIALKTLGWGAEEGRAYLLEHYGKRSRHLMSDEDLVDFTKRMTALANTAMPKPVANG